MSDLVGQQLGQYEVIAIIGGGGMATVYRARQAKIEREVAIKVIKSDLADITDFVQRFEREARTVASLSHPHILKLFDYGEQNGMVYLVMELLTGGSLADVIRREGPLPLSTISNLLDQLGSALDYAHRQSVIHRDLKPQNVLLDHNGNAFLTDFGIAKLLGDVSGLTQTGAALGTPSYMAPEQWLAKPIDSRADIYALGVMLFEMLTGRTPYLSDTPYGFMHQHVYEPPPAVSSLRDGLPVGIQAVLTRALAKDREQRFSSASELASSFKKAISGSLNQVPNAQQTVSAVAQQDEATLIGSPTPILNKPPSRRRSVLFAVGMAVVILVPLVLIFASRQQSTNAISAIPTMIPLPLLSTATPINPPTSVPSISPTNTPTNTVTPTNTSTSTSTSVPTSTPQPSDISTVISTASGTFLPYHDPTDTEIVAFCDQVNIRRQTFRAGTSIAVYWSWDAKTAEEEQSHVDNAMYDVRVDGKTLMGWENRRTDIIKEDDGRYYVYWFMPPLTGAFLATGQHQITLKVTWKKAISDGEGEFGPGTSNEIGTGSCGYIMN